MGGHPRWNNFEGDVMVMFEKIRENDVPEE